MRGLATFHFILSLHFVTTLLFVIPLRFVIPLGFVIPAKAGIQLFEAKAGSLPSQG